MTLLITQRIPIPTQTQLQAALQEISTEMVENDVLKQLNCVEVSLERNMTDSVNHKYVLTSYCSTKDFLRY